MTYAAFIESKSQLGEDHGFDPGNLPDFLFDFQRQLVTWALRKGRAALFADCGLGKTPMQLVWAEQVARYTDKRVLILTPLAVSHQTLEESEKFGIACERSQDGSVSGPVVVTNYERLQHFFPSDFAGVVCDESSILKSFDGVRRVEITTFMRKVPYRLLCTATAAPNDYTEMGTSSEALGYLGHMDMLGKFFKNDGNAIASRGRAYGQMAKWRFKGHAELPFWRWVTSWARAIRRPSDMGCDDAGFALPPLTEHEHMVQAKRLAEGMLFALPAVGLKEQREERRRTIAERCERVAELVNETGKPAIVWCHLNDEGDLLEQLIPDAVQVAGKDSDDAKEDKLMSFAHNKVRVLVTKPKIGAWGLNFQHCAHVTMFPSHSFEQYYQAVRRCWRFGQTQSVTVDLVTTEGQRGVMANLQRKSEQADRMFTHLVNEMQHGLSLPTHTTPTTREVVPAWLA